MTQEDHTSNIFKVLSFFQKALTNAFISHILKFFGPSPLGEQESYEITTAGQ